MENPSWFKCSLQNDFIFDNFLSASPFGASVGVFFLSIRFPMVVAALLVEYIRLISSRYVLLCFFFPLSFYTDITPFDIPPGYGLNLCFIQLS